MGACGILSHTVPYAHVCVLSSPFAGNRELRNAWPPYVVFSVSLHVWLGLSFVYHLPYRRLFLVDVAIPASLFLPLASVTFVTLALFDVCVRAIGSQRLKLKLSTGRMLSEAAQNAAVLSAACCLLIAACEPSSVTKGDQHAETLLGSKAVCRHIFSDDADNTEVRACCGLLAGPAGLL